MARQKGSKNKKTVEKPAKLIDFNPRIEMIQLYKSLKPTPKNIDRRIYILKALIGG